MTTPKGRGRKGVDLLGQIDLRRTSSPAPWSPSVGELIQIGRSKLPWRVQSVMPRRSGMLLMVSGPIGSPRASGGRVIWVGRKALRQPSLFGGWIKLDPVAVKPLKEQGATNADVGPHRKGGE